MTDGVRTERKSIGRDMLVEEAMMGLERNLTLGKFSIIHKNNPI